MPLKPQTLWPDDIEESPELAPVVILRQQAIEIGRRTKNTVEGWVETEVQGGRQFQHVFSLIAPLLGNRSRINLFVVTHPIDAFYPLEGSSGTSVARIADESSFNEWIREQLAAPRTRRILSTLLAQSIE